MVKIATSYCRTRNAVLTICSLTTWHLASFALQHQRNMAQLLTSCFDLRADSQLITCKLQDLREPAQQWTFPYNMTCGSTSDNGKTAKVDTKCLISYSCPTDPLHLKRKSEMVCKKTGKWGGVMPDCTPTTQTVSSPLHLLASRYAPPT